MVGQGKEGRGYVKHEAVALARFVALLESRGMEASELLGAIDVDNSQQISLAELKTMLKTLNPSMSEKDLQAIEKFFALMDRDSSGQISRAEFLNNFSRAEQIAQTLDSARAGDDEFAET